jgi:hypothetical protein
VIALVIDQGARPGWTIIRGQTGGGELFSRKCVLEYGVATKAVERLGVVQCALRLAVSPLNLLAVYEDHTKIPLSRGTKNDKNRAVDAKGKRTTRSSASIQGQGVNLGRWLERFDDAGIPKTQQLKVEPRVWRARVLGKEWASVSRERAKEQAVLYAAALLGGLQVSNDTAESLAIAAYVFGEWLKPGGQRG